MEAKQNGSISSARKKHSFGCYSFWVGLVAFLQFICVPFLIAIFDDPFRADRLSDHASHLLLTISTGLLFAGGGLGLVFGIVGLFKDSKKAKAIMGIALSMLGFLTLAFFVVLALSLGK
jgi:hypothetical protein